MYIWTSWEVLCRTYIFFSQNNDKHTYIHTLEYIYVNVSLKQSEFVLMNYQHSYANKLVKDKQFSTDTCFGDLSSAGDKMRFHTTARTIQSSAASMHPMLTKHRSQTRKLLSVMWRDMIWHEWTQDEKIEMKNGNEHSPFKMRIYNLHLVSN